MKTMSVGDMSTLRLGEKRRRKITFHNVKMILFYLSLLMLVIFDLIMKLIASNL